MINAINPNTPSNTRPVKTSIFYINDVHGRISNMERINSVANAYNAQKSSGVDQIRLSAGDIFLGSSYEKNRVANQFLNWIGVSSSTLGNHEMDATPKSFAEILKNANYKLLGLNMTIAESSPLKDKIIPSYVLEQNGNKYAVIGIAPPDAFDRVGTRESVEDIKIDDLDTTIKKVQAEADKYKAQGINKIIVVSHIGYDKDRRLAQETSGIDIIIGGHSHELIKGVRENDNLVYSKSNEPVVITQAGKDGENAGILNAEFTPDGVLIKVQNNVIKTLPFNKSLITKYFVDKILGKPEVLGEVSYADPSPADRLVESNPHGYFIADAMRSALNTDIAILNAGNVRGEFKKGKVTTRDINDITPFADKTMICELSEKQIVNAINVGGKSFNTSNHKPGILLVSGLRYTMNDKGELKELTYIDKHNKKHTIDVNNPSDTRKFTVAVDDFFAYGGDNYMPVNSNPSYVLQKFDVDKSDYAAEFIKNYKKPIEIKDDGRIKIVKS